MRSFPDGFTLDDFKAELTSLLQPGMLQRLISVMPGMGELKNLFGDDAEARGDVRRLIGIIDSMTLEERCNPKSIGPSRCNRIAKGCGAQARDVRQLVRQFEFLAPMMHVSREDLEGGRKGRGARNKEPVDGGRYAAWRMPMPKLLRNVLAVVAGIVVGGIVNGALITLSPIVIAPPAGVDVTNAESLSASIHLFEPRHFIMPFLAHSLGTLAGALAAYLIAATARAPLAFVVGAVFLCGGLAASFLIPAPTWFIVLDLLVAYLPMAWLGIQIGSRVLPANEPALAS